jgi:hypothetical protein
MSKQLLAQAVAVAYNPASTGPQLLDVIGDLVAFGAFDAADKVLKRLRELGQPAPFLRKMEKSLDWLRTYGAHFEDSLLVGALAVVRDEASTDAQLLKAAECLVVWGSLDEADCALARLSKNASLRAAVARLSAASHQLRRSGIQQELQALSPQKSLNKPYEVLIRRREGAERTVIVFTGVALRFWLSLNALHVFLRKLDSHVIYLSDHSASMYLNGLNSVAPSYGSMITLLEEQLAALGSKQVFVLASSAGGFVGLRSAIDLQAECFAGMSIRTSLLPVGDRPQSALQTLLLKRCRDPSMIIDLRDKLEDSPFPRRLQLYCGANNKMDRAHAEHLLPRAEITYLDDYQRHDAISGLIARGELGAMLERFLEEPAVARHGAAGG